MKGFILSLRWNVAPIHAVNACMGRDVASRILKYRTRR